MTTKILTAALAFFTTFGFSSLMMQFALNKTESPTAVRWLYSKPTNKQVLRFLERDIRNGEERIGRSSHSEWQYTPPFSRPSLEEYREAVSSSANKSATLDDSELPRD